MHLGTSVERQNSHWGKLVDIISVSQQAAIFASSFPSQRTLVMFRDIIDC